MGIFEIIREGSSRESRLEPFGPIRGIAARDGEVLVRTSRFTVKGEACRTASIGLSSGPSPCCYKSPRNGARAGGAIRCVTPVPPVSPGRVRRAFDGAGLGICH